MKKLKWIGTKVALIELIYALYLSNTIAENNISNIAQAFETLFEIELGDIHHAFHKIQFRKNSFTLFLDKLRATVENHILSNL